MKYPGGLVLLPLVLAHGLRPGTAGGVRAWLPSPGLVLAGGFALVGFLVGTPYAVLTPVAFVGGVLSELREVHTVQFGNEADMSAYLFHLLHSLPEGMGVPLFLLGLGGVALALLRHGRREVILLAFPLPYFLVIGSWSSRFERYTLPLLPFLALLARSAWSRWSPGSGTGVRLLARPLAGWPGLGLTVAATLLVAPELPASRSGSSSSAGRTPRAGRRVDRAEIPDAARIAMEPYSPAIRLSPAMVGRAAAAG
jgi:hypothetical protein